jgi:hypothetical protein
VQEIHDRACQAAHGLSLSLSPPGLPGATKPTSYPGGEGGLTCNGQPTTDERLGVAEPAEFELVHPFGSLAAQQPPLRAHGFASPPYDGFAFVEDERSN